MPLILGVGSVGNFTSGNIDSGASTEGLMLGTNVLSGVEETKADSEGLSVKVLSITK